MIDLSTLKELIIDGIKLVELYINGVLVWKSGPKNWVPYSTESDGKTIYNGGLGYKNGYRIRSGGAEGSHAGATCTGYIPIKAGDVIRMSGYDALVTNNGNAINVFDKNYTNLGQVTSGSAAYGYGIFATTWPDYNWAKSKGVKEESPGVYAWTVPPDDSIAFARVTGYNASKEPGASMIVTINEEIT